MTFKKEMFDIQLDAFRSKAASLDSGKLHNFYQVLRLMTENPGAIRIGEITGPDPASGLSGATFPGAGVIGDEVNVQIAGPDPASGKEPGLPIPVDEDPVTVGTGGKSGSGLTGYIVVDNFFPGHPASAAVTTQCPHCHREIEIVLKKRELHKTPGASMAAG